MFGIKNWNLVLQEDERTRILKMKIEKEKLKKKLEKNPKKFNQNINNSNKKFHNKIGFKSEEKLIYNISGPIFNLITNNNNRYFYKNYNNLNPPKKGKRKSQIKPRNHYLRKAKNDISPSDYKIPLLVNIGLEISYKYFISKYYFFSNKIKDYKCYLIFYKIAILLTNLILKNLNLSINYN